MLQESGEQSTTSSSSAPSTTSTSTKTWIAIGVGALLLIIIVVTIVLLTTKEDRGWECSNDGDCGNGRYCSNGVCINGCLSDDNCAQYQTCYNGLCYQRCSTDEQCIGGHICESGACVQGCNNNSQCPQGEICVDKVCVTWCGLDIECPEGKACYENRCVTGCRTDKDCIGQICNDQKMCASVECSSNADCPEEWACGDSGYCVRTGCIIDIDCLSGQCVNGVCTEPISCESRCRRFGQACYLVGSSLSGYCRPSLVDYGCYAVPGHVGTPFGFIPLTSGIPLSDIASPEDLDEIIVNSLQGMMRRSLTTIAYPFYVAVAIYYIAGVPDPQAFISWSNTPPASSIGTDTVAVNPDNKYCSVVSGTLKVGCNGYNEKYNPIPIFSPCSGIGENSVWRVYQYFPSIYLTPIAGVNVGTLSPPVSCPGFYLPQISIGYSDDIINSVGGVCPSGGALPTVGKPSSKQKVSLNCDPFVLGGIQVTGKTANLTSVRGICYDGSLTSGIAGQMVGSVSSVRCPLPLVVSGYYATTNEQGNLTGIGLACLEP